MIVSKQNKSTLNLDDFPYDKVIVRKILGALKENGYFYRKAFNPETVNLTDLFSSLSKISKGIKILGLTIGPKIHNASHLLIPKYEVPNREIFASLDNTSSLAGSIATYRFKHYNNRLKLYKIYTHLRC